MPTFSTTITRIRFQYLQKKLKKIGIIKFNDSELQHATHMLESQISIGMKRNAIRDREDGGLMAIPSSVKPITQNDWDHVIFGKQVLVCGFGGTNWEVGYIVKENNHAIRAIILGKRTIAKEMRKMTFHSFITLMTDTLLVIVPHEKLKHFDTIAISFGFIFETIETIYGMDARFLTGKMRKFWQITDFEEFTKEELFIGRALLNNLEMKGFGNITQIYFQNDTTSVANNIHQVNDKIILEEKHFPIGFVCGTGTNASLENVNLEAGHAHVLGSDAVLYEMARMKLISPAPDEVKFKNYFEYWTGGDNMRFRVVAAFNLLGYSHIAKKILLFEDPSIISIIVSLIDNKTAVESKFDMPLSDLQWMLLCEICKNVLILSGQLIGGLIAASLKYCNYRGEITIIPIEGSVFWKASLINFTVNKTLEQLIPENKISIFQASGMQGIGELALALSQKKRIA